MRYDYNRLSETVAFHRGQDKSPPFPQLSFRKRLASLRILQHNEVNRSCFSCFHAFCPACVDGVGLPAVAPNQIMSEQMDKQQREPFTLIIELIGKLL